MISFEKAVAIVGAAAQPLGTMTVPLDHAFNHVLAAPVTARIDSPRAAVSAMDGYAVRSDDLKQFPVRLAVIGHAFPGRRPTDKLEQGTCVRIFTGAPLPDGADRVVIQEQVLREGGTAIVEADPGPAIWTRSRAKDFAIGELILSPGRLLDPPALLAAAGADVAQLEVYLKPRLVLLTTGDELVDPGRASMNGFSVPDSLSLALSVFAEQWGARIVSTVRLGDNLKKMERAARDALREADVIVVTGGASVGERDFAKAAFTPMGIDLLFSTVAMRPGKPVWVGRAGAKLVVGLPGNPTSAMVTARLLLAPLLAAIQGRPVEASLDWAPARLISPLPNCDGRETFHRARVSGGNAEVLPFQQSHAQKTLANANALVRQKADSPRLETGHTVQTLPL